TLPGISKRGNKHLRRLLVLCARAFMMRLEHQHGRLAEGVQKQAVKYTLPIGFCED
ncbi:transposase, partial [Xenorhabdus nematophila]|nr:transposase [Xenorhabdus nematophila]